MLTIFGPKTSAIDQVLYTMFITRDVIRLTASEFDVACLIIHRVPVQYHVTCQGQGQSLAVQHGTIRRQTDQSIWNSNCVKDSGFQVSNEDVWSPESIELVVIQRDAGEKMNNLKRVLIKLSKN